MADAYLLESGAPDRYQLEDGSGVYLLDTPPPIPNVTNVTSGGSTTAGTPFAVNLPASSEAYLAVVSGQQVNALTPPSNWTHLEGPRGNDATWNKTYVYYANDADAPGTSWSFTTLNASEDAVHVRILGLDSEISSIDAEDYSNGTQTSGTLSGSSPSVNTTVQALIVRFVATDVFNTNPTITYPGSTENQSQSFLSNGASDRAAVAFATSDKTDTGATGTATWGSSAGDFFSPVFGTIAVVGTEATSGQTVTVGQPSTTDTVPGAVTRQKTRTPTQPSTTDTALAATRSKTKIVGQPSTTDTAPPATKSRTRTVGQPATTDTALPVQVRPIKVAVGQPSTTDTAQPVTRRKVVAVGQPSTTDTAPPVAKAKRKAVTLAATTDTAITPTRSKTRAVGLPSTTDLALTSGRLKLRLVGQPATTDTARPVGQGGTIRITVGQPSDTSTAFPISKFKTKATGLPASTDSARPAARIKLRTPTQPATVDEVLAPARLKRKSVGQPLEVDSAFAAARIKARQVGQPSTLDAAHRVYYPRIVRVGQPFTVDTARPVFNVAAVVPVVTGHLGQLRLTGSLPVRLSGYFTKPNIEGGI